MVIRKGYKQTEVGVIPEDWDCREINSEIKEISMGPFGSDIPVSCFTSEGVPVLNGHSVSKIKLIDTFKNYVSEEKAKSLKKAVAQPGDIIVTHRGTIGQISYIPIGSRYKKYVISQSQFRVRLNRNAVNPHFVVSYFLSPKGQSFLLEKKGHTGVPALAQPTTNFRKLCIPLPSLPEQEQIVNAFEDIDDLILSLEKHISKKKAIKQGAMQELLTGKRRLPGFSGEWETRSLNEISTEMVDGPFGSNLKTEHYTTERQVRIIQLSNIGEFGWNDSNVKYTTFSHAAELQRCIVQPGSVLIAKMMPAGRAIICPDSEKSYILGSDVVKVVPNSSVDSRYLVYATKSQFYLDQIADDTQGSTRARTSVSKLRKTAILFPTKDEQIAIANILSDMDKEIAVFEEQLAKYRQVKQGMMQQLLTGKIRLTKDIEDSAQPEQVTSEKAMPSKPAHNHQFDDAVAIAAIVDAFYSDKYPLGRVKVQKLLYLLHRYQAVSVSDFKKKAAGPYADTVRYKGGEPIAKKNKYIVSESGKQGTRYSKGEKMDQALDYVERWGMQTDLQWLKENFLHTSRNDLELFATVDMAMCDLDEAGISVSVESIKNLIASNKEWKAKLSKTYFSDWDIARAIKKCTELFN